MGSYDAQAPDDIASSSLDPASGSASSQGGKYPRLLCGRSSLYSFRHAAIFRRASNKFANQLAFKRSSRNFP
jgi:hypothetical protein